MKIVYCITSSSWGGAQLHVLELCEYQLKQGNDVTLIVGTEGVLLNKVRQIKGIHTILLPCLVREISPINDIKAVFSIRKILKKIGPDIAHFHSSKAGALGRLSTIGLNVKSVFTVHGWAFTEGVGSKFKKIAYKYIEKFVEPFTDLFICVSKYDYDIGMEQGVLKKEKNNAVVVVNGVPEPKSFVKRNTETNKPVKIVMTARFSKQKDQETLIRALSKISCEKITVVLIGDGDTLEHNKVLTQQLGLGDTITFLGFKNDVSKYLQESDLYVLSTHYEGLPISIIEAMSYSLPIIATNVGGNSELVLNNQNGLLVNHEDVIDLKDKLEKLIKHRQILYQWGLKSFELYEKHFQLSQTMKKINDEYIKLMTA